MKAIEIMQKHHAYDLDFSMSIDCQWKLIITNLYSFCCNEWKELMREGFYANVYTNIYHTDDGYGFEVVIF